MLYIRGKIYGPSIFKFIQHAKFEVSVSFRHKHKFDVESVSDITCHLENPRAGDENSVYLDQLPYVYIHRLFLHFKMGGMCFLQVFI